MFSVKILLLGLALATDAAVVSFALGLIGLDHPKRTRIFRGLTCSGLFGFFQFFMLWLGSYGGYLFSFSFYGHLFQILVSLVFVALGMKFFQESLNQEKKDLDWGIWPVLMLAFFTSIDALAAGLSFGTLPHPHLAALSVGVITFIICGFFYYLAHFLQQIPSNWILRLASIILTALGGHILYGHIF